MHSSIENKIQSQKKVAAKQPFLFFSGTGLSQSHGIQVLLVDEVSELLHL